MTTPWRFHGFMLRLNEWIDADDPPEEFRFAVLAWLARFQDNPRYAAKPFQRGDGRSWFATIAENQTQALACIYLIDGSDVRCGNFTILRKPI